MARTQSEPARPATGHIPFPGHRTVYEIWRAQDRIKKAQIAQRERPEDYGFDPESLKARRA